MIKHEQAVRAVYPLASIERQRTNGGKTYYLVRKTRSADMYAGSGSTKAAAWKAAAETIQRISQTNPTPTL